MQVTVEEVNELTKRLKITLPEEEVSKELNAAFNKLKSDVKLKGYRKGKVPRTILEKNYGQQVKAEVGEKLIQATYFDAVEQEKLDVVVHPDVKSVDFEDEGTFKYEVEVDVRPQFELKDYKGLEIEKPESKVSEEEVNEELERLRKEMAPLKSVEDRSVAENDICIVDFQGYHEGQPVSQVRGEDTSIDVGSGRHGKGFEDILIGLNKGDEVDREVDFPADSPSPVLAGKKIEFKIAVKDVKERIMADLDDEFAKDVGEEFETMDALKEHVRNKKITEKEEAQEGDISDRIMQKLVAENPFEVPARLVQYEIDEYLKQMEETLKRSGMTLESAGINREEAAEHHKEAAEKRVRGDFILKKISELEEMKLEEEDINNGFGRIAKQYNMTIDEVKGYFKSREDMMPFLNELLNEKILRLLKDEASFKIVEEADDNEEKSQDKSAGE